MCPPPEDQCSGVLPLRVYQNQKGCTQKNSYKCISKCVGIGLGILLVVCCIHVCFLFYQELANVQEARKRRPMQRGASTVKTKKKT
jgi:hypothetical protein